MLEKQLCTRRSFFLFGKKDRIIKRI